MSKELVTKNTGAVAAPENYITDLLQAMRDDFIAANDGLDLDFVNMGSWLVIDKKGRFVEKDGKDDPRTCVSYGDSIDVVIGRGEKRWSLWGKEGSPEDGQLLVAEKEKKDADAALTAWLMENPQAQDRYSLDEIELRYLAFIVPVESIGKAEFPKIFLMSFSPSSTLAFGKWAMDVYQGKYRNLGIPARTGVHKIVTRFKTNEKTSRRNASQSWIGLDFEAVGMFNPADYGVV